MAPPSLPGLELMDSAVGLPGLRLPVCSPVVTLDGARVLLSPGSRLSDAQLGALGAVTDIVAPSLLHTAGMARAAAALPAARVWGPQGMGKKLPGLRIDGTLGETPWPYQAELRPILLEGMPTALEHVFVHRASRALLVTDLVFNLLDAEGLGARIVLGLLGTYRRLAVSRLFARFVKDRAALRRSLDLVLDADFEHLVPGHGSVVVGGARARLAAALRERGLWE